MICSREYLQGISNWYDKNNIEYSTELEKSIKANDFNNLSDEDMLKKLFEIEPGLFGTPNCIEILKKKITKHTPVRKNIGNGIMQMIDVPLPPIMDIPGKLTR